MKQKLIAQKVKKRQSFKNSWRFQNPTFRNGQNNIKNRWNINKETEDVNNTVNQLDVNRYIWTFNPITEK